VILQLGVGGGNKSSPKKLNHVTNQSQNFETGLFGIARCRWEDNTGMDLGEWDGWARTGSMWLRRAVVNAVMNLRFP
jgi:hypothetical protein